MKKSVRCDQCRGEQQTRQQIYSLVELTQNKLTGVGLVGSP